MSRTSAPEGESQPPLSADVRVLRRSQKRSVCDARRSADDVLMRRKAWPLVRLEHMIAKGILRRHGEIWFDFMVWHISVRANLSRNTDRRSRCTSTASLSKPFNLPSCVLGYKARMAVIEIVWCG